MTDKQKKTTDAKTSRKTEAYFVDPRGKSDEEVANELIEFLDRVQPLPSEDDKPTKK